MLSRVICAATVDLQIALFCTAFPLLFGTIAGAVIGYFGGPLDAVFGRLVDLTVTVPFLILVIAIVAVLGPGLFNLYIAVSVVGWVPYARLVRSEMMVQAKRDYAAAARVMGFSTAANHLRASVSERDHADHRLLDDGSVACASC